jgi:hypothetical protein
MNRLDLVYAANRGRSFALAFMVSAALSSLGALPSGAQAQNNSPDLSSPGLTAPGAGIPEAPVGHRQPRPSELPPSVNRAENAPTPQRPEGEAPSRPAIDQLPTICVKC